MVSLSKICMFGVFPLFVSSMGMEALNDRSGSNSADHNKFSDVSDSSEKSYEPEAFEYLEFEIRAAFESRFEGFWVTDEDLVLILQTIALDQGLPALSTEVKISPEKIAGYITCYWQTIKDALKKVTLFASLDEL